MYLLTLLNKLKLRLGSICNSKSSDLNTARHELILNILIVLSIIILIGLNLVYIFKHIIGTTYSASNFIVIFLLLLFLIFLLYLSKKGKSKIASCLLIITYFIPISYCLVTWKTDLPIALTLSVLVITLCAALLNAFSALLSALFINIILIILTVFQKNKVLTINNYWRAEVREISDILIYAILITFIALVVYIYDQELKNTLLSLQASERKLKKEKESLEIKVKQRTKEVRQMEAEKISQLYRLAEFGKISYGVFHDLINPLTAISLNLEQIDCQENIYLGSARDYLKQAIIASSKMEDLISSIRKSIKQEKEERLFSPIVELESTLKLLKYQASKENITVKTKSEANIYLYGDVLKFNQILANLIINSIDACKGELTKCKKLISVNIKKDENFIIIRVSDNGKGILAKDINKIFDTFFTTKKSGGLGLGLSSTKNLIEKFFKGSIEAYSKPGEVTIFIIKIPISLNESYKIRPA